MNLLGLFSWAGLSGHTSLPTSAGHWRLVPSLDTASSRGKHINKRYVRNSLAGVLAVFVLVLLHRKMRSESKLPPLYEKYIDYEREMPQHSLSLPYPEGKHAKFLWFANHGSWSGWGNHMQEMVLNAHLAYSSKRAYVFDNYTWDRYGPSYSDFHGKAIPSRIPLSAIISGPMIGGSMGPNSDVPRSVSREYFNRVCPESERTVLHTGEIMSELGGEVQAHVIVDTWVKKLDSIEERCVEFYKDTPQLFNYMISGSTRVLSAFPSLSKSPILAQFGWSPLILSAFKANIKYFDTGHSSTLLSSLPSFSFPPSASIAPKTIPPTPIEPLVGLMAIHIRRGDYVDHCHHFVGYGSEYGGFNRFPELPDKFVPPQPGGETPENTAIYLQHCYPTIPQIVEKVMTVKAERKVRGAKDVKKLFVMTNGASDWLEELKDALWKTGGRDAWDEIATSRDLELTWEQKFVAQALDMYVGQRAEVLIGNGWSSLTSNVVMLRMANKDLNPLDTRFW